MPLSSKHRGPVPEGFFRDRRKVNSMHAMIPNRHTCTRLRRKKRWPNGHLIALIRHLVKTPCARVYSGNGPRSFPLAPPALSVEKSPLLESALGGCPPRRKLPQMNLRFTFSDPCLPIDRGWALQTCSFEDRVH